MMIIATLFVMALYFASWVITCALVKSITLLFGWTFNWIIATGIWCVMLVLKAIFTAEWDDDDQ